MHINTLSSAWRKKIAPLLAIDRAVLMALLGKVWGFPASLITTVLIGTSFSSELQGYYYTFNSVVMIQTFVELGLGTVITYYASHEWARLSIDGVGRVTGDANSLSRLISLGQFAIRWYFTAGIVLILILSTGGYFFFLSAGDQISAWKAPWAALCLVSGLVLCTVPIWSVLEGCNQVANVYTYRLLQGIASSISAWVAIHFGAGLWTAPISLTVGLLVSVLLVWAQYGRFLNTILLSQPKRLRLNWRNDILPMQWRIAVSSASGYFTFALFTPVLFHYHGAVVAGQFGMTWVLTTVSTALASSWVLPRAPTFGILIAQRKYAELDQLFWKTTQMVLVVAITSASAVWALVAILTYMHHPFAIRLLSPAATGYLALAAAIVAASLPMSTYLRAHKMEPLLKLSIISGILNGITVVSIAKQYSVVGITLGYLTVTTLIIFLEVLLWRQKRIEWHTNANSTKYAP